MPADEFLGWRAYFEIYPFTQEREDERLAILLSVLTWSSGRTLKRPIPQETFLPDYLGTKQKQISADKSIEQQRREFADFKARYQAVQRKLS